MIYVRYYFEFKLKMARRMSNVAESRLSSAIAVESSIPHDQFKVFSRPSPFVYLILMVILGFVGNVGY
jgi:hypothetical protein